MKKILIPLLAVCALFSCTKESLKDSTKISVRLTDAPTGVEEVNIDLLSVVIFTDEGKDSIDLETKAGIYNLLDYQNGLDTLIGSGDIQGDTLKQVRLVLGENNSVKLEGVEELIPLTIPSGQSSGLKVKVNESIADLEAYVLTLDFDADKSLKITGNNQYKLHPVIKVLK